jgi:hypothetical protein
VAGPSETTAFIVPKNLDFTDPVYRKKLRLHSRNSAPTAPLGRIRLGLGDENCQAPRDEEGDRGYWRLILTQLVERLNVRNAMELVSAVVMFVAAPARSNHANSK